MNRFSRVLQAGGQNAVPLSGWFLGGGSPGTTLAFTLVHGVFLAIVIMKLPEGSIARDDLMAGVQWMLAAQVASLAFDLWRIGGWPFAEIRSRTEWVLGRVVVVHLSILVGMFLFMAFDRPAWFFTLFLVFKAMIDIGSLLPQWEPKDPPAFLVRVMNKGPKQKWKGKREEPFVEYWHRTRREEQAKKTRDEEVVEGA